MTSGPSSPFKGLNAFEDSELDALLFFGREREREIVVANLIASRLTVLYGPSGVGKSSLLGAAVARSLRELPEEPLVVVFSRWSDDPSAALSQAVAEASGRAANGSPLETLEHAQEGRDVYLVLDQAEEYFLYHADDSGPGSFAEALPKVLAAPQRINVLVSLREDSLAKLDRFTGRIPGLFANTLRLDRLDRKAATAAIVGPLGRYAELTNHTVAIEPELVERVLDEVGAGQIELALGGLGTVEGAENGHRVEAPYLQLVMQRLWEEERASGSDVLRVTTLDRLGGAQRIVEEHLNEAVAQLAPTEKDVAARLFNHLVTPSGTKIAHEVSDLADFGQVPADELRPVLAALADRRILRSVEEGGSVRYEIFHDVLAQPVLAWRASHEAERELEVERESAQRRQRRLLAVIGVGAVLLAVMAGVTAFALTQRSEAQKQATIASRNAAEAEAQKGIADQNAAEAQAQEEKATQSAAEAETQKELADQNAAEAQAQEEKATQSAAEAEAQTELAEQEAAQAQLSEEQAAKAQGQAQQEAANARDQEAAAQKANADAQRAANEANARALAERALTLLPARPLESLRLALKAAAAEPTPLAERVLRTTLVSSRVRAVLPSGRPGGPVTGASFSPDGRFVLTVANPARIFNARTGSLVRELPDPAAVNAGSFSPDGRLVVTADKDGVARVWPIAGGAPTVLAGHGRAVMGASFSHDGGMIATASLDRTAIVWRTQTGEELSTLQHDGPVESAEISPDGKLVVTMSIVARSGRRLARMFDATSGKALVTFDQVGITSAAFSPDGTFVVTTSNDDTTRVWDPDGDARAILTQPDGNVVSAAFSPDGTKLVTASAGSSAVIWNVGTWDRELYIVGPLNPLTGASFSPDGRFFVVSSRDRTAQIFRSDNGLRVAILVGHESSVTSASFGPSGRSLVTASEDGTARIWDPGITELLEVVGKPNEGALRKASLSPDGRLAVSAGADGTARILLVSRRRELEVLRHDKAVNDAEFGRDGSLVVTASDDGTARIWSVDGEPLRVLPHGGRVLRAIFSPDGELVATAGDDALVRIWRASDGRPLRTLRGHVGAVLDIAFSPDGRRLASAGDNRDRSARIWRIDGKGSRVLGHRGSVVRVTFSPDGRVLATASGDEMARLWSVDTGKLLRTLRGHTAFVRDVKFSSDGNFLVTASDDSDARIWNVSTGGTVRILRGHFGGVQAASFSPDGRWVVTAGPRTAGLWDASTGQFLAPTGLAADPFLRGPTRGPVTSVAFAPDGKRIVTASADGTVRTYLCGACGRIHDLIRLAEARLAALTRGLTAAEQRRYLRG